MKNRIITLAAIFLSSHASMADTDLKDEGRAVYSQRTTAHSFTNADGKSLNYRIFLPEGYSKEKKYPLVLALHGAGSRGTKNVKHMRPWVAGWSSPIVQKDNPCIILMPQCPPNKQWVNTPWRNGSYSMDKVAISEPMSLAKELFDKVVKEHSVDESRIYLIGCSMGGYGCWNFIMRWPELVAAAVPVCGGGDPSQAEKLVSLPIWTFHGDKDTVVPMKATTDMVDAIKKAGGEQVKLTVYPGVSHNSYAFAWKDPELIKWVFSQRKNPK
ncbi:hypothetical protein NT6N_20320 [Oceaniferula spumae]|uniref:Dienelactone hydrolase domain-containing protein n=1 Tax=Oceaniferula spumae TaxID=2979115 RepID=A0AAT9FM50_9BACT